MTDISFSFTSKYQRLHISIHIFEAQILWDLVAYAFSVGIASGFDIHICRYFSERLECSSSASLFSNY